MAYKIKKDNVFVAGKQFHSLINCTNECVKVVSRNTQKNIFSWFYKCGDRPQQDAFLSGCCEWNEVRVCENPKTKINKKIHGNIPLFMK